MRSVALVVTGLVALAVLGPLLAPYDPTAIDIPNRLSGPTETFPLGTDALGRDI
ncbi:MAG: ABC transporter permease, partial [Pseudomonadota bacterium]